MYGEEEVALEWRERTRIIAGENELVVFTEFLFARIGVIRGQKVSFVVPANGANGRE